ncbi:YARHG domain-containing protein [Treponema bryantii]|uniref:YARHG domain-containing protein n=2 Tax=Treponema bryantii TaxID=163 RepID=A0A1H9DFN1_9SPIR|nr:YARHG domain-containing protein [Treponema bryantii]
MGHFPLGIYFNEVNNLLVVQDPLPGTIVTINLETKAISKEEKPFLSEHAPLLLVLGNNYWGVYSDSIEYSINNTPYKYISDTNPGISFILKKDSGYIVYFLGGAIDSNGRIYSEEEAMAYLKQYDPEKYEQSKKKAAELSLYNDFIRNNVLIWGNTYYKEHNTLQQYDLQGYRYFSENYGSLGNVLGCYLNDDNIFYLKNLNSYSEIRKSGQDYSFSWYVGFGGNIYYYVAGKEYTEMFRIRRTWGEPDFYAMAINGYTDDSYGQYVNKVLPTLSKAELRLLRNTIFAIYGVHFKSADLSTHFAKQVWYTDEGKTSGEIKLSAHRQKLVEMIQKLEK